MAVSVVCTSATRSRDWATDHRNLAMPGARPAVTPPIAPSAAPSRHIPPDDALPPQNFDAFSHAGNKRRLRCDVSNQLVRRCFCCPSPVLSRTINIPLERPVSVLACLAMAAAGALFFALGALSRCECPVQTVVDGVVAANELGRSAAALGSLEE
jgi:hypothetical protein